MGNLPAHQLSPSFFVKDKNILGKKPSFDHRTLSHNRQEMTKEKGTTVMIRLLKEALGEGISAKYVLFDSWFSNPRQLLDILGLKLHAIAMIKRSAKCYYEFEGKRMTVKQILQPARSAAAVPNTCCPSP